MEISAVKECKTGWTYFDHTGKCYQSFNQYMTKEDAVEKCRRAGAVLVSIPDMKTNDFILSKVSWRSWIGLEKQNGAWMWTDGSVDQFRNWIPGEPSGDGFFAEIAKDSWGKSGHWNDLGIYYYGRTNLRGAICQYDPGCNCGIANTQLKVNRVKWGSETEMNKYPWMVRVLPTNCGGTLISNRHVLTAAHCLLKEQGSKLVPISDSFVVDLGEHDYDNTIAKTMSVSNYVPHPKYGPLHVSHYDIAVMTLSSPVSFTREISPICLPADTLETHAGQDAILTGWGQTELGRPSSILKEVDCTILSDKECEEVFGSTNRFISTEICAVTSRGPPSGGGDSGGPLHVIENGRYTQVGVLSGHGGNQASVFIRTGDSSINKWIKGLTTGTQDSNC